MSSNSPNGLTWSGVPRWLQGVAFIGALGGAAYFAVRLGGTSRMEPWLVLVFGMLAGRVLAELLGPATR